MMQNISIQDEMIPCMKVIYMRRTGAYGPENHELMERFKTWLQNNQLFCGDTVILGMALDDMNTVAAENCRYDVCMVVEDNFKCESQEISIKTVPSGKYATLLIPHTAQAVQSAWRMIPALCEKGYELDFSKPILERYAKRLVDQHYCELCVPVM